MMVICAEHETNLFLNKHTDSKILLQNCLNHDYIGVLEYQI